MFKINIFYDTLNTPVGVISLLSFDDKICEITFGELIESYKRDKTNCENLAIKNCKKQILEYFQGKRKTFDIKIHIEGTDFQKKVWNELKKIPYGEVLSYKQMAEKVHSPKAFRAVGNANNKNKIPFILPCHRVIGHNKKLVGFAGGLNIKKYLLELEGYKDFK